MAFRQHHFITVLFLAGSLLAAEPDKQGSLAIAINQDLPWGFDLDFVHDLRFKENNSTLKKSITEVELSYRLTKHVRLGTGYRYSLYPDAKNSKRVTFSTTANLKTGAIRHKVRLKFQQDNDSDDDKEEFLRFWYVISYKRLYKFRPFLESEGFYNLDHDQFEKQRFSLGINRKLTKQTDMELYYRIQNELNVKNPQSYHMLGLTFKVELK